MLRRRLDGSVVGKVGRLWPHPEESQPASRQEAYAMQSARRSVRRLGIILTSLLGLATVVAGCGGSTAAIQTAARALHGGTATFALQPDNAPNYIFPLVSAQYFSLVNEDQFEWIIYRPLYWFGKNGTTAYSASQSLADYPNFSVNAAGDTVASITMKHWLWSDGQVVTTRDVEFWMNLLEANKDNWGVYVPGAWPDIIKSIAYPSPTQFTITFNAKYNVNWLFENEMSQIFPIPQHLWDKTSGQAPIGNNDETPVGAVAVYNYLNNQSHDLSSYGTNPLWKVVDGPWIVKSHSAATGYTALARNTRYSGPNTGQVSTFEEVPFSSGVSEFDALRAGNLDVGYLPPSDLSQTNYLKAHGYSVSPWWEWNFNYISINFNNPKAGPVFKELYFRQAMQSLVDQPSYISHIYKGYAKPTYGPIPTTVSNQFVSPQAKTNPYPYSVSRARSLLSAHGWAVHPNGSSTCKNPGTGAGQCGAGISGGSGLSFKLIYATGSVATADEMAVLRSSASQAGIDLTVVQEPFSTVTTTIYGCDSSTGAGCSWQMGADSGWEYYAYPSGEQLFKTGGSGNSGGYSNPEADTLINATLTQPGLAPIFKYENYLAKNVPVIYLPTPTYQITVYKSNLKGVLPQDPSLNLYPETWSSGK
jgi:peptide/nickel transport system substrate-binding protein